jgi:hypothetical protein
MYLYVHTPYDFDLHLCTIHDRRKRVAKLARTPGHKFISKALRKQLSTQHESSI